MTYLKKMFKPGHIWLADDIFGFHIDGNGVRRV